MPAGNFPLYALNQGEVSKIALARVDVAKMRLAAACQVNWLPFVLGPMMLRPGLQQMGGVLGDQPTKLVRFAYSKTDTALLELTPGFMRIWIQDELLSRVAVGTTISDPNFTGGGTWSTADTTAGASVTIGGGTCSLACAPVGGLARVKQAIGVAAGDFGKEHGLRLVVQNGPVTVRAGSGDGLADYISQTILDTGTHSLVLTPTSANIYLQIESTDARTKSLSQASIEPAGVVALQTPWQGTDLPNVRYDQSGDIIYEASYGLQQYKVERRGERPNAHGWSIVLYRSNNGPFQPSAGILANFTPSAYYGNGTLTSDRAWFQTSHVGALFRLFSNGQFNQTVLGNQNAFSPAVRVVGVGTASRNYSWTISGSWTGTITLQRSFDGPDSGFVDVSTLTSNGTIASSTGGSAGTPNLDNVIAWERVGFKGGGYGSGSATVVSAYAGGGGYGLCRVTGYNSPTSVNIEILQAFSSLTATNDWVESDWSGVVGWPSTVAFHEGRLGFAGRDEIWLSHSDGFDDFRDIDNQGDAIGDAGAIIEAMGSGPVDSISWLLSLSRLQIGREQSIGSARSSNFDQPLTPTGIVIRDSSDQGAARLPALKCGKRGIYVGQNNRVYELAFNAQEMDYDERDLTRLNLDIIQPGFVDADKATHPDKQVVLPRTDGQAAVLLYDVKDEVEAWWRMQTLGVIENYCVLPQAGVEDAQYFVVRRTINGVTRRFIEKLALRANCAGGAINQQLDCHMVYQGAPVSTVQLPWLPNTEVAVWADGQSIGTTTTDGAGNCAMPDGLAHSNIVAGLGGKVVRGSVSHLLGDNTKPDQVFAQNSTTLTVGPGYEGYPAEVFADIGGTGRPKHIGTLIVSGGVVTLPNLQSASTIVACLGYVAPFMSAKLAYAAAAGTALTQKKRITHCGLVMFDTDAQGITFGQRFDIMDSLPQMEAGQVTPPGTVWWEYDEPAIAMPGEWDTDARLCLLAQAPRPCTVGGVVVGVDTSG